MCFSLEGRKRRGRRVINISSGSGTGDFEGMLRIEVGQEDSYLCRWERDVLHTLSTCTRFYCYRHVLSLKEGGEENEGESRSPLGAEQEAFRECFGLRWTKKIASSVGAGGAHAIRLMCTRPLIISLFTGPIRGECDTHSCPDTLSYDRFSMNRKRPTAYDGSGALFLGRNWRL